MGTVSKAFAHQLSIVTLRNFNLFHILPLIKLFEIGFDCIVALDFSDNFSVANVIFSYLS